MSKHKLFHDYIIAENLQCRFYSLFLKVVAKARHLSDSSQQVFLQSWFRFGLIFCVILTVEFH